MTAMEFTTTVQQDPDTGECYFILPDKALETLGWQEGDELSWTIQDGAIVLENLSHKARNP